MHEQLLAGPTALDEHPEQDEADSSSEDLLVEEVSIDGMCGVY